MSARGRPLRFLLAVTGGWIALRTTMLWPRIASVPALIDAIVPDARATALVPPPVRLGGPDTARAVVRRPQPIAWPADPARPRAEADRGAPTLTFARSGAPDPPAPFVPFVQPGVPHPAPRATHRSRWSGSFWLLARPGDGIASGVIGGQLGGSQAGLRIVYALDTRRRVALAGRLTAPLGPGQRELALGIEWQPSRLPVRLVVERRIALNGGRAGPALGIVGGAGPVALGGGFRFDGYGQAGVIRRDRAAAYADGAAHLSRPVGALGGVAFDLGAAVWGAAQPGAARLDVGPSLGIVARLGRQPVRLSLDWRERVAGRARPGSGLALTLGADF